MKFVFKTTKAVLDRYVSFHSFIENLHHPLYLSINAVYGLHSFRALFSSSDFILTNHIKLGHLLYHNDGTIKAMFLVDVNNNIKKSSEKNYLRWYLPWTVYLH